MESMKIAILADIHGNDLALRAVLREAKAAGAKQLLILGDSVGYYYRCHQVLRLLEAWPKRMLKGNHEVMLERAYRNPGSAKLITKKYGSGIVIALKRLKNDQLETLFSLPSTQKLLFSRLRICICHGAPWCVDTYIYPDANKSILNRCLAGKEDFVFAAHTHRPFMFKKGDSVLVNVGSVGQSRQRGGSAQWVLFDPRRRVVCFKTTFYNPAPIVREVKKRDPHLPFLWKVLERQRKS